LKCRLCGKGIFWGEFVKLYSTPGNIGGGSSRMMNHVWEKKVDTDRCCWVCADCGRKTSYILGDGRDPSLFDGKKIFPHSFESLHGCRKKCKDCGLIFHDHDYTKTGKKERIYVHMDSYEMEDIYEYKCIKCSQIAWDSSNWGTYTVWEHGEIV
jgi:hypothetical protein